MYHYSESGLDNVYLINGYEIIQTPEGKATSIHNFDELQAAIANSLVDQRKPLTGKEFRFLRIELDMSQKALGQLIGKKDQTIAAWEKGQTSIHTMADAVIRQIYKESKGKNSKLRKLLDIFNEHDRNQQEKEQKLEFVEDAESGWRAAC